MDETPPSGGDSPAPDAGQAEAEPKEAEEMGKASFPASDPPAVWTWEPRKKPADSDAG